jgi:hypothetical protein
MLMMILLTPPSPLPHPPSGHNQEGGGKYCFSVFGWDPPFLTLPHLLTQPPTSSLSFFIPHISLLYSPPPPFVPPFSPSCLLICATSSRPLRLNLLFLPYPFLCYPSPIHPTLLSSNLLFYSHHFLPLFFPFHPLFCAPLNLSHSFFPSIPSSVLPSPSLSHSHFIHLHFILLSFFFPLCSKVS